MVNKITEILGTDTFDYSRITINKNFKLLEDAINRFEGNCCDGEGSQYVRGFQGIQGAKGKDGKTGGFYIQGIQGIQGFVGFQGSEGLNGEQGIQGISGFNGETGSQGAQGIIGFQGIGGVNGSQGLQGIQGVKGTDGVQGIFGIQGIQGVRGPGGSGDSEPLRITYLELLDLRNNSELDTSVTYQITDYATEINPYPSNTLLYAEMGNVGFNTEFARITDEPVLYDILVNAIDNSHLSENCKIVAHDGVTFFDNYDIKSWKIKYTIDNDINRFDWAKNYYEITLDASGEEGGPESITGFLRKTSKSLTVENTDYDLYLFNSEKTVLEETPIYINCIMFMVSGHTPSQSENIYIMQFDDENIIGPSLNIVDAIHMEGKGVVYEMEDCFSNKLGYDYLNIQFKLYALSDVTVYDSKSYLNTCLEDIKNTLVYGSSNVTEFGTRNVTERFGNVATMFSQDLFGSSIKCEFDLENSDWYYTFDLYDDDTQEHENIFYYFNGVTMEKAKSSLYMSDGFGFYKWSLPFNVFQINKDFIDFFDEAEMGYEAVIYNNKFILNWLDLKDSCFNIWCYNFKNGFEYFEFFIYYGSKITIDTSIGNVFVRCNALELKNINMGCYFLDTFNMVLNNSIGNLYSKSQDVCALKGLTESFLYKSNNVCITYSYNVCFSCASNINVGNNSHYIYLIGYDGADQYIENVSIGNNCNYIQIYGEQSGNRNDDFVENLTIGNNVEYFRVYNNDNSNDSYSLFKGCLNNLVVGDNCRNISFKDDLWCENINIEQNSDYVILYMEDSSSNYKLKNISVKNPKNNGTLKTLVPGELYRLHKVGLNSNNKIVCYVEEDLVEPVSESDMIRQGYAGIKTNYWNDYDYAKLFLDDEQIGPDRTYFKNCNGSSQVSIKLELQEGTREYDGYTIGLDHFNINGVDYVDQNPLNVEIQANKFTNINVYTKYIQKGTLTINLVDPSGIAGGKLLNDNYRLHYVSENVYELPIYGYSYGISIPEILYNSDTDKYYNIETIVSNGVDQSINRSYKLNNNLYKEFTSSGQSNETLTLEYSQIDVRQISFNSTKNGKIASISINTDNIDNVQRGYTYLLPYNSTFVVYPQTLASGDTPKIKIFNDETVEYVESETNTFTVEKDMNILVDYTGLNYTVSVTNYDDVNGGTVTGAGLYQANSVVELEAFPNDGFVFSYWVVSKDEYDNNSGWYSNNPYTLNYGDGINGDYEIMVYWTQR